MFWKRKREEVRTLRLEVDHQARQIAKIEEALNDATRLMAKEFNLKLLEDYWLHPFSYNPLERIATRTVTKHVKEDD
ncbi:hypothetical protein LCGC14_1113750 [marine sediment metagenome]|uniref:Uncharacterized protein n=1 Tax=marine sediment metagenome TaxID=412755 RepID=A0A0F9PP58_9ZZZZ